MRKRLRLARLFSIVPNTKSKNTDEESILRGVISYVQGLQKQVKDIREEIALLQSNIYKTDHDNMNKDVMQAYKKEGCQHGDDKEVIQKKLAQADYGFHTDMLQALHVKEVNEKTFHIQIRCKREAGVLQRLTKILESLQLPMDFYSANLNAVDGHFICNVFLKTKAPMKAEMLKQIILDAALQMLNPNAVRLYM